MNKRFKANDKVQIKSSKSAALWPGRWSKFPQPGEFATVVDLEPVKVVVESVDAKGTVWWVASFDPADLELVMRPGAE